MHSTLESVESPLDVVVHFSDEDWERAKRDIEWATIKVIEELKRYKSRPEEYFSTKPRVISRIISWKTRIRMEIIGHLWTGDRNIRFSEWWIVKIFR
ncbi:Uncharacterised protein [uncultured archaeon]|nr:Uncharacterised protein [uncultured archaeon]